MTRTVRNQDANRSPGSEHLGPGEDWLIRDISTLLFRCTCGVVCQHRGKLSARTATLGIVAAWLLMKTKEKENKLVKYLEDFRNKSSGVLRLLIIAAMFALVVYMSLHTTANHWPILTSILGKGYFVESNLLLW